LPEFLLLFLVQQQFLTLRLLARVRVGVVEPMQLGFHGCWVKLRRLERCWSFDLLRS
jgi:hypothetical protein